MKCPHCGHDKSRVTDTEARPDANLRYRICLNCAKKFSTLERVSVFAGRRLGHIEAAGQELAEQEHGTFEVELAVPPKSARRARPPRYAPTIDDPALEGICDEAKPLLLQWWNESRWSKHGTKATWTEAAWSMSMDRVRNLPSSHQQIVLARTGVEAGWQALKPNYLDHIRSAPEAQPLAAATGGRPAPQDPAMLAALESWPA